MQLKTFLTFATVAFTVHSSPLAAERELAKRDPQIPEATGLGPLTKYLLPGGGNPALAPAGAILKPFTDIIVPQLDALQAILNDDQIRQVLLTLAAIIPERVGKVKREAMPAPAPQVLSNPAGLPAEVQRFIISQLNTLFFTIRYDLSSDNLAEARGILTAIGSSIVPGFTLTKRDADAMPQDPVDPTGLPEDVVRFIAWQLDALFFFLAQDQVNDGDLAKVRIIVEGIVASIIPGFRR